LAFTAYYQELFIAAGQIPQVDTFVGTGLATKFPTPNKSFTQIGNIIQYGTTEKFLYQGGFTKNNDNSVTLASAPLAGSQGVIPAINSIQIMAYDQTTVPGVSTPNIGYGSFWIGDDLTSIATNYYAAAAGQPGIQISLTNLITGAGLPDSTFLQLASSDVFGNALTYQATGTNFYTDQIKGFSTVAASGAASSTSILTVSATGSSYFIPGDYIILNIGNPTAEIRRISSISYNTLTLSASTSYPHYVGEPIFSFAREIKVKMTMPYNFTNNTANNFYNMVPLITYNGVQRS
jgi:hypothetical protein